MVFGILGLVVCGPLGIAAWVMGSNDLEEMAAGTMDPSGRGLTSGGRICGIIASILMIVAAIVAVLGLVFFFLLSARAVSH